MKLAQKLAVNYLRARLNLLAVISKKSAARQAFRVFCTPFYRSKKSPPPVFEKAEQLSFDMNGNMIRGYRWKRDGARKVLLLHGFESSSKNFEAYVRALIKKGYEVLAFDAPGHGISGGRQITLPMYILMISIIQSRFGAIESFMTHSFGGLALIHYLENIPHDAATRVVLIAPATETSTAIDSFFRFLQLDQAVRKEFEQIIIDKSGMPSSWFSIPRALQHIKASVLWVHDENDDITPLRDVKPAMESNLPGVSFLITQGLGHKKIYRDNRVIKTVVDFL